jgi:P-type E1-E2 ATPase
MLPLVFVLAVTAIKDAYEDYRRYRSDRELNSRPCLRVAQDNSSVEQTTWADLVVGDLAVVKRDEPLPADMLVIASSGENGVCYISSMNLDGESNLKLRRAVLPDQQRHK